MELIIAIVLGINALILFGIGQEIEQIRKTLQKPPNSKE